MWSLFWISLGIMCAINGALALLMVLADATIGNYGRVKVTVNGRRTLDVEGGRPLLATLKDEQIFIPSACGGRGSCGLCKVKVKSGAGDALATELPWLTKEERAARARLACQVKVKRDTEIEIPEELFNVRQYRTRVASMRDLTHDIKEVRLQLLEPDLMEYAAGQFVQFEVPPYELADEPVYRAYSMSSEPAESGTVELEIRYVPQGVCTTYVHRHLKEGDEVTINGPYGEFRLREGDAPIICIAGGSGMAPIKSILNDMKRHGVRRKALYFFGAKTRRDLFLVDEMRALEKELPDFRFIPALSSPAPEDKWDGEQGLITQVVDRHVPDASGMEAYLCGSPMMIDACIEVLKRKGMPAGNIFYDKFA
jgi:Na+-transporting NADH:ubiquinone oxidoreductase subunit F